MKSLRLLLTVIITIISVNILDAAVRTAITSGKWDQPATWKEGILPSCGDSVMIGRGITVEVSKDIEYLNCLNSMKFTISGTLIFPAGHKLMLPCKSTVQLNTGGNIKAATTNAKSNLIDICNVSVWNAGMGNLEGPLELQLNPPPAQVVDFTARQEGSIIVINWVTSSELNNDFFTVEKSRDGITFEELGQFDAAGTSANINSYKVYDIIPSDGIQYYRLRQSDFSNNSTVSRMVGAQWNKGLECNIYPNPTQGELFANLDTRKIGKKGQLLVNNADGKLLLSKNIEILDSGYGFKLLQTSELLKPGNYLVTLNFNEKSFTQYVVSR